MPLSISNEQKLSFEEFRKPENKKEDVQSFHYALTIRDNIKRKHPFVLNKNTCKYQSIHTTRHYNFKGHV